MQNPVIVRNANSEAQLISMFLYQKYRKSPNTHRAYKTEIERLLAFLAQQGMTIATATVPALMFYQHSLQVKGYSTASQARALAAIKSLFGFAENIGYLPGVNPSKILEFPKVANITESRFLSKDEARAMLQVAKAKRRDFLVISLLMATGVRVAEFIGARWGHLYRSPTGELGLTVMGKGLRPRSVLIPDRLFELLVAYRRTKRLPVDLDAKDDRPLIMNPKGGSLSAVSINKIIRKAALAAGIRKPVSAHWCRHFHATAALLAGAPADLVAQSMGNSLSTLRVYMHSSQALQKASGHFVELDL